MVNHNFSSPFGIILPSGLISLHSGERIDSDRHSQVGWRKVLGAMIFTKTNGSGDRHRSFPGGIVSWVCMRFDF